MKSKEEIEQLAIDYAKTQVVRGKNLPEWDDKTEQLIARYFTKGYTQCQQDMADEDKWNFEEILDACYPTLGRGSDWCFHDIVKRLREQKINKQE